MKTTVSKVLRAGGKAVAFMLVVLFVLLLFVERLHETFFTPFVNFIRTLL